MKQNSETYIAIGALIAGLFIGYLLGINKGSVAGPNGTHMMSNGSMMSNGGSMDMDDMMKSMNAGLMGKTGDEFDQAFLSEMIVHHQGAVEMAQLALTNAKHQEIKNLAQAIISAQNTEIAEMKSWNLNWYNK